MKKCNIGYHVKILIRGLVRMIWGALTAGTIYLAVYGFVAIANEGGYAAVCDFIGAVCLVAIAFCSMYLLGVGSFCKARK